MLEGIEEIDDVGALVGLHVGEELRRDDTRFHLVAIDIMIVVFIEWGKTALGVRQANGQCKKHDANVIFHHFEAIQPAN